MTVFILDCVSECVCVCVCVCEIDGHSMIRSLTLMLLWV